MADTDANALIALVLFNANVPCGGPRDGMVLMKIVQTIDERCAEGKFSGPLRTYMEAYRDGLMRVAGIWAAQQALTLDALATAVEGAGDDHA